ncbi:MAG: DUF1049 domain-containing protein [Spirochaetales bacterium]|nr:DUF1049 domain-containing protein [Spirochaetales bacterium]
MVRLIFNILFLIILAVFVAMNMSYKTDINLFTVKIEQVSVVAVVLLSIVAGVLYSFLFYLASYFGKIRKDRIQKKAAGAKQKEQELKDREKNIQKTVQEKVIEEKEKAGLLPPEGEKAEGNPVGRIVPKLFQGKKNKKAKT